MAYTTPKTWAAGELVTADLMNEQLRDNMNYLYANNGEKRKDLPIMSAIPPLGTALPAAAVELVASGSATITPAWYQARYDGTANEGRMWNFTLPVSYISTPVIKISYNTGTASAVGSTTIWGVQIAAVSNGDLWGGKEFPAANLGTSTIAGTSYVMNQATVTLTSVDSMAALDGISVLVYRNATGDTFNLDAVVTKVEMFYL
jgi:hypothetical protein